MFLNKKRPLCPNGNITNPDYYDRNANTCRKYDNKSVALEFVSKYCHKNWKDCEGCNGFVKPIFVTEKYNKN